MLLDAIASYLQTSGIGTVGVDIFKAQLPDSPDAAVGVFDYAGRASDKAFGTTILIHNPSIQIQVRGSREGSANAVPNALSKAAAISTLLDGAGPLTISGVIYYYIEAMQPPFSMPFDENRRPIIVQNFWVRKQPE